MQRKRLGLAMVMAAVAVAGHASAQGAPPAKVCKNLLGKVIPCPPPKPMAVAKPMVPAKPVATTPASSPHLAMFGHPAAPTPPMPAPAAHPSPKVATASGGGSQTSRIGATAQCKDGTYWRSKTHTGACSHHNGVAVFY